LARAVAAPERIVVIDARVDQVSVQQAVIQVLTERWL
jgi:thymidylate kinase